MSSKEIAAHANWVGNQKAQLRAINKLTPPPHPRPPSKHRPTFRAPPPPDDALRALPHPLRVPLYHPPFIRIPGMLDHHDPDIADVLALKRRVDAPARPEPEREVREAREAFDAERGRPHHPRVHDIEVREVHEGGVVLEGGARVAC
ncbi:hypothetical protein PAXINDRAFT_103452 [Paxillus involutus ATCC 200175]|uniref:Uncharacterized protein n=1 Tax=Paxillus involutus ATCC 200175 TaxID=664439 RepID=A0A0C9TDH0_PAXIN|nr:hypothetical protein PAXINDRAFT_103452 [Paxillus involutus ATCC 200175]